MSNSESATHHTHLKTHAASPGFSPIIVDADEWLRSMRLPYWALNQFRTMKVGDELPLVGFSGPGLHDTMQGEASVVLSRNRGAFELDAGWLLHVGKNAQIRGHLWSAVGFKILPGRKLELLSSHKGPAGEDIRLACMSHVTLVMRRAALLSRWAKSSGDGASWSQMHPGGFAARSRRGGAAEEVPFLLGLRGPDVSSARVRRYPPQRIDATARSEPSLSGGPHD